MKNTIKERIVKPIFLCTVFFILIYLIWPAMTEKIGGIFIGHSMPEEYKIIEEFIKTQPENFRTFWRPHVGRFAFYSLEFPLFNAYHTSPSTRFFFGENWNNKAFSSKYIAKLLGLLNIKYCFIPQEENIQKLIPGRDKNFYLSTYQDKTGLEKINIGDNVHIFENKFFSPRFFATNQASLVVGSKKALLDLADFKDVDLSSIVVFFSDELKFKNRDLFHDFDSVIFYDSDINDLVLNSISDEYRLNLTKYATRADEATPNKWQQINIPPTDLYGYLYGVIAQNPKGVIYAPDNCDCELISPVEVSIEEVGMYEVWIRAIKGPDMGTLSMWTSKDSEEAIFRVNILKDEDLRDSNFYFQWIKAKAIYLDKGKHFFSIINKNGKGVLDQLVIVPQESIDILYREILDSLTSKDIVIFKNSDSSDIDVSIPKDGRYHISVKIGADNFSGSLDILVNNHILKSLSLSNSKKSFSTEYFESRLKKGVNKVSLIKHGEGEIKLQKIILYETDKSVNSIDELFVSGKRIPVEWKMINPTSYKVKLKTESPTYLILSEPFDPRWILNLDDPVNSISAYSMINSFFIANPEDIDAALEFTPQKYVYRGVWVSGIGLVLICGYLFYVGISSLKKRKARS